MEQTPAAVPFDIPHATVKRWNDLPASAHVVLHLSRQDVDHLFFAIDENTRATTAILKALIEYTNGDLFEANKSSVEAANRLGVSSNRLRMFMNAAMVGAELDNE